MIFVYLFDVSKTNIHIETYESLVSEYRRLKVKNCRNRKDKLLSLFVELLLNYGLYENFPYVKLPALYKKDQNGRLYFDDQKIHFSLSHSGCYAVCAISDDEIGVDIEKIRDINLKIAQKMFTESENAILSQSEDKSDEFFRIWVLKESHAKARGLGFKLGFKNFSIDNEMGSLVRGYSFYELDAPLGYKLAVCKRGEIDKLKIVYVDLAKINILKDSMDK